MVTVKFNEDIKLTSNNYENVSSFMDDFIKNNYQDSNITNEYIIAADMKKNELPDSFIKNFIKSYE